MSRRLLCVAVVAGILASASGQRVAAQLAAPGESGVVMGHLHLVVKDVEGHRKFWAVLGGTPVQNGTLQLIQIPGMFVMLRQAEPTGGNRGLDGQSLRVPGEEHEGVAAEVAGGAG